MKWYCLNAIVVDTRGYFMNFLIVVWKYNQALLFMCPDLTLSVRVVVVCWRRFVCSRDVSSGGIHTLSILEACGGGSLSMDFSLSEVYRERWELLFTRCHFPAGSQVNSRTYHLFFYTNFPTSCPI